MFPLIVDATAFVVLLYCTYKLILFLVMPRGVKEFRSSARKRKKLDREIQQIIRETSK